MFSHRPFITRVSRGGDIKSASPLAIETNYIRLLLTCLLLQLI